MTTNHHTPVTFGAAATAATINTPLGELDSAITTAGEKAAVSSGDTTPDFLENKLAAGSGIAITKLNPGANEDLEVALDFALPSDEYQVSADLTTTSTTFVDMDATNLNLSITTNGGDVLVVWYGTFQNNAATAKIQIDFSVDGTDVGTGGAGILRDAYNTASSPQAMGFAHIITGLSVASHTFKMRWKTTSGTATLKASGSEAFFAIKELA
jgi:hypothetical protein